MILQYVKHKYTLEKIASKNATVDIYFDMIKQNSIFVTNVHIYPIIYISSYVTI